MVLLLHGLTMRWLCGETMKDLVRKLGMVVLMAWMALVCVPCCMASGELSLENAWNIIKEKKFVDLTHAFSPGIPHWKGFPDETVETLYWYEPGVGKLGSGFYAQSFTHVGQWGTHVDPPAHFVKGMRTVDQIDVKEMILPLVVIDVHDAVANDHD